MLDAIPRKVVARLRVGRTWTAGLDGGLGFVAGRLGTWLGVRETAAGPVLRVEVRLASQVADARPLWNFVAERQREETLLGCWIHDPGTRVLSLVAELPVAGGEASVPMLARCVAELVYEAEAMAWLEVPERELDAVTAWTVIGGAARERPHHMATHLRAARGGRATAETVLAEVGAAVFGGSERCSIEARRHPRLGWGLRLAASPGPLVWQAKADGGRETVGSGEGFLARMNRLDAQIADFSPGRWAFDQDGITYRVFLSAAALEAGRACAAATVTTLAQAVAARAVPLPPTGSGRLLAAANWPGDGVIQPDVQPLDPDDIPSHPNRLTVYELIRARPPRPPSPTSKPGSLAGTIVLVDVENDPEQLYIIPEAWARSELRTYATLRFARTYRDVSADQAAVQTVVDAMGRLLEEHDEDLTERELFERLVAEDAPFDADEFFGDGGWRQWRPIPEKSSASFAAAHAPVLWRQYKEVDGGWGIDYDPVDYLPAENQDRILAELRILGCEILPCPGLVRLYYDPTPDLVAQIDGGEWPPRLKASELDSRITCKNE